MRVRKEKEWPRSNIKNVMGMKTTKITWFSNQNENKGNLSSKSIPWNKKNKNKNTTCANKNPTRFYCKKETKQGYGKKTYQKLVLNTLKVMGNSTFIYTYWGPSSKNFLKKLLTYTWPMCTYVWTRS